ncbi:MAG: DUF4399 domain-containing protein [Gammaproteobacteria bacterium]|nr:MAG: DUF4399 domain-containing protein [Gammaproteobacteria bacterium]
MSTSASALLASALLLFPSMGAVAATEEAPTPAREGARVYIISPADGETVPRTFTVKFGLQGMGVAPAGVDRPFTGHHHLLVDGELPALDRPLGQAVRHFGGGQTEATLTLEPGRHTLRLILGDHRHRPHQPPLVSEEVVVHVR